mmetsp:Transcript_1896/g.6770  ORF Transcript_1896/g.6770 Transcript_1896/m.6770 type:complete len:269 (-) Transcript_1896:261-1067(-)
MARPWLCWRMSGAMADSWEWLLKSPGWIAVNMRPKESSTTKRHTPAFPGRLALPRLQKELGEVGDPWSELLPLPGVRQSDISSSVSSGCGIGGAPPCCRRSWAFSRSSSWILLSRRALCSLLFSRASEMSLMSSCFFCLLSFADSLFMILLLYDLRSDSSSAVSGRSFSISEAIWSTCSHVIVFSSTLEMMMAEGTCFARFLFLFGLPAAADDCLVIFFVGLVSTAGALRLLLVEGGDGEVVGELGGLLAGDSCSTIAGSRNNGWKRA